MDEARIWIFVHIMLLVYWLGADLGVFILARRAKNAAQSVETRAKLLEAAMAIDLLPRICFALMVPVGTMLAIRAGALQAPGFLLPLTWAYGAVWAALTIMAVGWEGKPAGAVWRRANLTMQAVLGVVFVSVALWSLYAGAPVTARWLSVKLLFFGLIYPAAIMIDVAFQPGIRAFGAIAVQGSTQEREAAFSRSVDATCLWVLAVYALVSLAAFWGVVQPA